MHCLKSKAQSRLSTPIYGSNNIIILLKNWKVYTV